MTVTFAARYEASGGLTAPAKVLCFALLWCVFASAAWGGFLRTSETNDRRISISLSIFPRVVAVDNDFRAKLTRDRKAKIIFVYDKDSDKAAELKEGFLEKSKSVAGMELEVVLASADEIIADGVEEPTAFFLTEQLSNIQLYGLVKYATLKQRILFSPFVGDVERGATAGIAVSSRVKPYFNLNTLHKSEIEINALLMKLSKRYE